MKTPKRIRIVDSKPVKGQDGIEGIIGDEFDVIRGSYDADDETVSIIAPDGRIVIQREEYEVLS